MQEPGRPSHSNRVPRSKARMPDTPWKDRLADAGSLRCVITDPAEPPRRELPRMGTPILPRRLLVGPECRLSRGQAYTGPLGPRSAGLSPLECGHVSSEGAAGIVPATPYFAASPVSV